MGVTNFGQQGFATLTSHAWKNDQPVFRDMSGNRGTNGPQYYIDLDYSSEGRSRGPFEEIDQPAVSWRSSIARVHVENQSGLRIRS